MTRAARFSYFFILVVIVGAGVLHLATPLITVLFSSFALSKLHFIRRKWVSILLFLALMSGILYGLGYIVKNAVDALPKIASESFPSIMAYAKQHDIELPFSDFESLKATLMDMMKDEFRFVGNFARNATKQFVFLLIGIVVAVSMFLNPGVEKDGTRPEKPNLYTSVTDEIACRFRRFYLSFETVIGAQLVISA